MISISVLTNNPFSVHFPLFFAFLYSAKSFSSPTLNHLNTMKHTKDNTPETGIVQWESPSNIALVKYWGKSDIQIPKNPSISFTLREAKTITQLEWTRKNSPADKTSFDFLFHGSEKPEFIPKLEVFFQRIDQLMPFLKNYHLRISSENTFPHSSGIASSASAMSALAATLVDMEMTIQPRTGADQKQFSKHASEISRLGSGSACRSFYPEAAIWGQSSLPGTSDRYAIGLADQLHPIFHDYRDAILLIEQSPKAVTSTAGHHLMEKNPYASLRFSEANQNINRLLSILQAGDLEEFVKIVEAEALTLHALMMTSDPGYILMHPRTLEVIQHLHAFREESKLPVCFTLDAGPNVHLLYPAKHAREVEDFIQNELITFCQNQHWIRDQMGEGAKKLN